MSNDIRRAADALYQRGYEDAKKERDFDPRKTTEWLVVVGLPSTAGQRGEVVPEGWGMAAFRHKWEACETQCECKVCGTVFGAMPPPSVQKGWESHFAKPRVQPNAQPGHCSHARTYNGRVCCDCGAEVDPATQNFGRYGTATPAPAVPEGLREAIELGHVDIGACMFGHGNAARALDLCSELLNDACAAPPSPTVPGGLRSKIRAILKHHAEFNSVSAMLHEAVVADLEAAMLAASPEVKS